MHRFSTLYAYIWLAHVTAQPLGSCYYPDGQWAPNQYPCNEHEYIAFCCPSGWSCYSNMLCVVTDPSTANSTFPLGTAAQATCTDPRWSQGDCGNFCTNNTATNSQGLVLTTCGDDNYCCPSDSSCSCSSGQGIVSIAAGALQTIISRPGASYTSTPSHISFTSSSTSIRSSTSSSTSPTSTTSSSSTSSTRSSTTSPTSPLSTSFSFLPTETTATSLPASTYMSTPTTTNSSAATTSSTALPANGQHTSVTQTAGFKAGIAVAAIVIAAILIALLLCCFLHRRKHRSRPGSSEPISVPSQNHPQSTTTSSVAPLPSNAAPPAMAMLGPLRSTNRLSDNPYARATATLAPGAATRNGASDSRARMAEMGPEIYPEVVLAPTTDHEPMSPRSPSQTLRIVNKTPSPPPTPIPPQTTSTEQQSPPPVYTHEANVPPPTIIRPQPYNVTASAHPVSPIVEDHRAPWSPLMQHPLPPQRPNVNEPLQGGRVGQPRGPRRPVQYYDGSEDFYQ